MSIKYSEILAADEVLSAGNDDIIVLAIVVVVAAVVRDTGLVMVLSCYGRRCGWHDCRAHCDWHLLSLWHLLWLRQLWW